MKRINVFAIKQAIKKFIGSKKFIPIVSALLLLVFPAIFFVYYAASISLRDVSFKDNLMLDALLFLGWGVILFVALLWTKMYKTSFVIYILLNLIYIPGMIDTIFEVKVIPISFVLWIILMCLLLGYYDLHLRLWHSKDK